MTWKRAGMAAQCDKPGGRKLLGPHAAADHVLLSWSLDFNCAVSYTYEGVSKIFRTDRVKCINLTTKRAWKLPTSTQLSSTWQTDSLDMVVLPSTGASRYHNCCISGGISPEYFGYTLVQVYWTVSLHNSDVRKMHLAPDCAESINCVVRERLSLRYADEEK
jgi:hypothetical protein